MPALAAQAAAAVMSLFKSRGIAPPTNQPSTAAPGPVDPKLLAIAKILRLTGLPLGTGESMLKVMHTRNHTLSLTLSISPPPPSSRYGRVDAQGGFVT